MTTEKAVLAGGCFWGMQDMFRRLRGVVSTRAGYTGGDSANPSYGNHQGHAEAIEIVFDPAVVSYRAGLMAVHSRSVSSYASFEPSLPGLGPRTGTRPQPTVPQVIWVAIHPEAYSLCSS